MKHLRLFAITLLSIISVSLSAQKAVDLGLPSGTLWADRNIGADESMDCGNYYAWGETEIKEYYGLDNYKYGAADTTFVNIGSDIAGSCYDVAHEKWGNGWTMPTKAQWDELRDNCTWTWTLAPNDEYGIYGFKVRGTNGNYIFLPAAGSYCITNYGVGRQAGYWSSTLDTYEGFAMVFSFGRGGKPNWSASSRTDGRTVRPVKAK